MFYWACCLCYNFCTLILYPFVTFVKKKTTHFLYSRTPRLLQEPVLCGLVKRVATKTPKKPNSGIRKIARIWIKHHRARTRLTARISGNYNFPSKFNHVLVRGGRANDLPGIGYTIVRGALDSLGLTLKKRKRSKYGAKRAATKKTRLRRAYRKLLQK